MAVERARKELCLAFELLERKLRYSSKGERREHQGCELRHGRVERDQPVLGPEERELATPEEGELGQLEAAAERAVGEQRRFAGGWREQIGVELGEHVQAWDV